ncbi:hypothetical protein E9993_05260 [Labilibacter sediminis]|nr:hypothetical protein E9993_05260 [Labilibacter sediminis]
MQKILITGGNFINKGAQSMLFCLVDNVKTQYPNAEIVMIDLFPTQKNKDKENYTFKIVNMHIRTLLRMAFPVLKLLVKPKPISNPEKEIAHHFKTADIILDISGYGVSSHNQSPLWTYASLYPVKLAKKNNIPFIFLPQTLGPFEFKGWKKVIIWPLIKKYLKYPKTIFIREPECRKHTDKIRTQGVLDSFDLVLQSDKISLENLYKNTSMLADQNFDVENNSIIIIPNKQLTKLKPKDQVVEIFSNIISSLLQSNHKVVIMRHSADDKELCNTIYRDVNDNRLKMINEDLTPYQIQKILEPAQIVIAARYHGLIHALKLKKPCFVIGWAHKYQHVMNSFSLNDYYFDIRYSSFEFINTSLNKMLAEKDLLQDKIEQQLKEVQSLNIYKHIK